MDPNYRASEQQWSRVEGMGIHQRFAGCECILELRARIEALEAAQQPDQIAPEPEWQQLSEREPQDGDRCAYRVARRFTKELGTWSSVVRRFWASDKGLFYGDPECISWRLAMPHELFPQQPASATEESSATAPSAPAVEPVPVSERLPGPEDCDAKGMCWLCSPEDHCWFWERTDSDFIKRYGAEFLWLPHWAFPVPHEVADG